MFLIYLSYYYSAYIPYHVLSPNKPHGTYALHNTKNSLLHRNSEHFLLTLP